MQNLIHQSLMFQFKFLTLTFEILAERMYQVYLLNIKQFIPIGRF